MSNIPLIKGTYILQRFKAKGGWTFVSIPEILEQGKWNRGGIKIKGSIDAYTFRQLRLMRTGDNVFLPLSAVIRKAIGKKEGDRVKLVLYVDEEPFVVPAEILECLELEPAARQYFMSLTEGYQKEYCSWINAAKQPATKAGRITKMIDKLLKKQTLSKIYDT